MQTESTLLFNRSDVQELLSLAECIDAVEKVFRPRVKEKFRRREFWRKNAERRSSRKNCAPDGAKKYIVAKLNTNFPQNYARFGQPTIQGVIVLYDADNGRLLAVLDSMEITIKRTVAATAVAAKYLARKKFISRHDLRLWRARPCSASRAFSHPFTPKSLRIRC